jgi:predicted ester cyclase
MNNKNPSINSIGITEGEMESKVRIEQERKVQSNIRVVRQALKVLNTGDIRGVRGIISPQYFNHESQVDPVRSKLRGPEEFMDTVKNLRNAFPDLHYEEQETVVSGDKVISVLTVTGKHTGNFFVIPPTGREISYQAVHIHRIGNDGKIVEHRAIRDDLTFMIQLGLVGPSSIELNRYSKLGRG